jgi:hypothetical protein
MSEKWNPATHPFRVRKIRRGGPHGWSDSVRTYADRSDANAAMYAKMTGGEYESQLDVAVFDAAGKWAGWKRLATRKINQKIKAEQ